jgi:hypothetical protein
VVELRESWSERFRVAGLILAVLVLGVVVAWLRSGDHSRTGLCRTAYAAAKTAADSARVDAWVPLVNQADAMDQVSCSVLRRTSRP